MRGKGKRGKKKQAVDVDGLQLGTLEDGTQNIASVSDRDSNEPKTLLNLGRGKTFKILIIIIIISITITITITIMIII